MATKKVKLGDQTVNANKTQEIKGGLLPAVKPVMMPTDQLPAVQNQAFPTDQRNNNALIGLL